MTVAEKANVCDPFPASFLCWLARLVQRAASRTARLPTMASPHSRPRRVSFAVRDAAAASSRRHSRGERDDEPSPGNGLHPPPLAAPGRGRSHSPGSFRDLRVNVDGPSPGPSAETVFGTHRPRPPQLARTVCMLILSCRLGRPRQGVAEPLQAPEHPRLGACD